MIVDFVFDCPHCREPYATVGLKFKNVFNERGKVSADTIDVHSGAQFECNECGGKVIFQAFTPEQYTKFCDWDNEEFLKEIRIMRDDGRM